MKLNTMLFFVFLISLTNYAQDTTIVEPLTIQQIVKNDSANNNLMSRGDSIVAYASTFVGVPYKYACMSPKEGFDCSGFVNYVFKNFNINVPRSSKYFKDIGTSIPIKECKPGDIILFSGRNKKTRPIGHVGIIYSNKNDTVKFIHSATSKHIGVKVSNYTTTKYYNTRLVGVFRKLK